ncbi:cbb3-type cytochrome c oxidase N-terminal domain-containing protein [Rapidithrix thailandica]|uniref:Cbb3-type cytochrome c oxidase N-terminal domain-containing protein n=1 Tax=Rapidithrix thailandica TaxID=413964 RepID=A0AAW9RNM0_9BACT
MKKTKQYIRRSLFVAMGLLGGSQAFGAAEQETASALMTEYDLALIGILMIVGLLVILALVLLFQILAVYRILIHKMDPSSDSKEEASESFEQWFWNKFNKAIPVSKEENIMLDHAYDGIKELDNDLPPWWKYGFYVTIVFSVVYLFIFHYGSTDPVSVGEFKTEMAIAEAEVQAYLAKAESSINENNVELISEEAGISAGKKIYDQNCKVCHGGAGEGGVGPNLTDEYWLHGGSVNDVFKTVKYGVKEKGMLPWQDKLKPKQIQEVSSFILTLQGTNPPNPKAPQGDKYVPES